MTLKWSDSWTLQFLRKTPHINASFGKNDTHIVNLYILAEEVFFIAEIFRKKGAITAVKYRLPSCRGNPSVYRMHVLFDKIKQTKRALSADR